MKTNTTLLVKSILIVIFALTFTNSFSNNNPVTSPVINLKANVENNNLIVSWNVTLDANANYCEVQASEDGIIFKTIGFVMGANPNQAGNSFTFKQGVNKIKTTNIFFRVLSITADEKAYASDVIKVIR